MQVVDDKMLMIDEIIPSSIRQKANQIGTFPSNQHIM